MSLTATSKKDPLHGCGIQTPQSKSSTINAEKASFPQAVRSPKAFPANFIVVLSYSAAGMAQTLGGKLYR